MPRKARIDAPAALHHIIVRGIERLKIVYDDTDYVLKFYGSKKSTARKNEREYVKKGE